MEISGETAVAETKKDKVIILWMHCPTPSRFSVDKHGVGIADNRLPKCSSFYRSNVMMAWGFKIKKLKKKNNYKYII